MLALAALLSSPDDPPVTIATWARVAPADFVATAASELAGTSETATYGPALQLAKRQHADASCSPRGPSSAYASRSTRRRRSCSSPLAKIAPTDPALAPALDRYHDASAATRSSLERRRMPRR